MIKILEKLFKNNKQELTPPYNKLYSIAEQAINQWKDNTKIYKEIIEEYKQLVLKQNNTIKYLNEELTKANEIIVSQNAWIVQQPSFINFTKNNQIDKNNLN